MSAIGDLDQDGIRDVAVNSANVGAGMLGVIDVCTLLSGATGDFIGEIRGVNDTVFKSVLGLDDIDSDGYPDILLQWSSSSYGVFSGAPGHELIYPVVGATGPSFAREVIDDVDGDGLRDFAIRYSGLAAPVVLRVHSARTGDILYSIDDCQDLAAVNDVDGDGFGDFAVRRGVFTEIGEESYVAVSLVSGVNGSEIWRSISPTAFGTGVQFGVNMVSGGDVNGDGYVDICSPERAFTGGTSVIIRILSGRTGATLIDVDLEEVRTPAGCDPIAFDTAGVLGDLDGDGYAEFAGAAPWYSECGTLSGAEVGQVYIFRGGPAGETESFCTAPLNSTGTSARLRSLAAPAVGSPHLGWQLFEAPPTQFTQLAFGPVMGPGEFPITIGSGHLCFGAVGAQRLGAPMLTDEDGIAFFEADWTHPAALAAWGAGTTWVVQALFRDFLDPARANTSNALRMDFY